MEGGEEAVVMLVPQQSITRIQRIPSFLRSKKGNTDHIDYNYDYNDGYDYDYDPKVVSLGPYHRGKPELQLFEGFKHKLWEEFISGGDRDEAFYRNKMLEAVDQARSFYVDCSRDEYGDPELAEMMLLDACLLLFFILMWTANYHVFRDSGSYLFQQIGHSGYFFVRHDIILFENQIPLWIVEFLFNARCSNTIRISWKQLLVNYCRNYLYYEAIDCTEDEDTAADDKPLHLLEAFHMQIVWDSEGSWPKTTQTERNIKGLQIESYQKFGPTFRSVMDLKSKGIGFSRSDNIYCLTSIQFESDDWNAKLKLPVWYVTPQSRVFFTNMIAYEMCPNSYTQLQVTSYISFMRSLIVCPNDAKELREKRIIQNRVGEDMNVVQLFKGLKTYGVYNPNIFEEVKWAIQEHYDSRAKTWKAELLYTYLRSPWSIIALLAASALLLLTCAQTFAAFKWHN